MSDLLHKDRRNRPTEGGRGGGGIELRMAAAEQSDSEQQNSQGSRRWSSMGSIEYSEQHGGVRSDQVEGWGGGLNTCPEQKRGSCGGSAALSCLNLLCFTLLKKLGRQ